MSKTATPRRLNRRDFLKNTALLSGGVVLLPSVLTSCSDEEGSTPPGEFGFRQGVASFDPSASSVILWTRYLAATVGTAVIRWEVAEDSSFRTLKAGGNLRATADTDYTVWVDVTGLAANQTYYYRFRHERTQVESVVGQTRTLPAAGQVSSVSLAVVSCSNYQSGLFNVYGAVAESTADAVVHLGDYIYEYGQGEYGTNPLTASLNRAHQPATETLTLSDYRTRYRQYRSDPQLQRLHQLKPFICVWDDHESANDAHKDGAQNHQPSEGSFEARKQASIQAWHEYLPARTPDRQKIYRQFDFGGLVNLLMLDTRLAGRDRQLSYADYISPAGAFDGAAFGAAWQNPGRTILGAEQRGWLTSRLAGSRARWQVLGSQVLMGKMYIPAELLTLVAQLASRPTPALLAQYTTVATQLAVIKTRVLQNDPTVTATERARVETVLPYNLDAWDGYPAEREAVFAAAGNNQLISLAGDTHNAWYSDLRAGGGRQVGAEFATPSVSSPGFETLLAGDATAIRGFEQTNQLLIDDLQYLDASRRGYLQVEFTPAAATAQWRYVGSLTTLTTATTTGKTVRYS
jgi:alkaline phosphatase D